MAWGLGASLIVECGKCGTRFQLDDARVPESGIRVRCSRCKEAFFLQHPSSTSSEVIQDVVERTVADPEEAPDPRQDQVSRTEDHDSFAGEAANEPDLAGLEDEGFEFEEEDWEFNEDLPESDSAGAADEEEAGDSSQHDSSDYDSSDHDSSDHDSSNYDSSNHDSSNYDSIRLAEQEFERVPGLAGNEPPGSEAFPEPDEPSVSPQEQPPFQQAPPQALHQAQPQAPHQAPPQALHQAQPQALHQAQPQAPLAQESDAASDDDDVFGSPGDFSSLSDPESPAAVEPAEESAFSDLLGESDSDDPEDWNFLTDGSPRGRAAPVARMELTTRGALETEDELTAAATDGEEAVAPLTGGGRRDIGRRVGQGMGWLLTAGLFAVGAIQGLSLAMPSAQPSPAQLRLGDLTADGIAGHWIETAGGEALYAVRGRLVNPGTRAVMLQGVPEVILLDSAGQPLALPPVQAGGMLGEAELRELSGEALPATRARAARAFVARPIGAGQQLPFVALFEAVPDEAVAFQVRAAPLPDLRAAAPAVAGPVLVEGDPAAPPAESVLAGERVGAEPLAVE